MAPLEESIDIAVPVATAYEAWTRFEDYPSFMSGVVAVEMLGEDRMRWRTRVEGIEHNWEAQITELRPDERIAWRSTGAAMNDGVVTFDRLDDNHTRVSVVMTVDVGSYVGKLPDIQEALQRRIRDDLNSFRQLLETVPQPRR
jgi:uncharacterized membrane protein